MEQFIEAFKAKNKNGNPVAVEAIVWYEPALSFDKHSSDSDWDSEDYLEILQLTVIDVVGDLVTTEGDDDYWSGVILKELHVQEQFEQEEGFDWDMGEPY
ncbi:hypothetical protein KUA24_26 [Vibrio phage HNL01]|nr:hypothetical protein KUA24_26 [Vibrio phage HNL01]